MKRTIFVITLAIMLLCGCKGTGGKKSKADKNGMVKVEGNDYVSTFWICDHEVTFGEWRQVMKSNPKRVQEKLEYGQEALKRGYDDENYKIIVKMSDDNKPVMYVSWYEAVEYCNARSVTEGLTPCYTIDKNHKDPNNTNEYDDLKWTVTWEKSVNGYRLPTEIEWEWAAKGGNKSHSYTYSGSNNIDDVAWYDYNANRIVGKNSLDYGTHNVKTKQANELWLYDMTGNVQEWCWDWYEKYIPNTKDYVGPSSGYDRSVRGGSWSDESLYCLVSHRYNELSDYSSDDLGFRVVRSSK